MTDTQTDAQKQPVGKATILVVKPGPGLSVLVEYRLEGRRDLPTTLRFRMFDAMPTLLAHGSETVVPDSDAHQGKAILRAPLNLLHYHPIWGPLMMLGQRVCSTWKVEVIDAEGWGLAEGMCIGEHVHAR